jgi:hypothetical protein
MWVGRVVQEVREGDEGGGAVEVDSERSGEDEGVGVNEGEERRWGWVSGSRREMGGSGGIELD